MEHCIVKTDGLPVVGARLNRQAILLVSLLMLPLSSVATNFKKAQMACINSFIKTSGLNSKDQASFKMAYVACEKAMHGELMVKESAITEIQLRPESIGCKVGAYWVIKGSNPDMNEKMLAEVTNSKCK